MAEYLKMQNKGVSKHEMCFCMKQKSQEMEFLQDKKVIYNLQAKLKDNERF